MFEIAVPGSGQDFYRITHRGEVSQDDLIACRQALTRALDERGTTRLLVDFSQVDSLPGNEYFIMFFSIHGAALERLQGVALIHRLRDHSHATFLSSVARFHRINCQAFENERDATEWLAGQG